MKYCISCGSELENNKCKSCSNNNSSQKSKKSNKIKISILLTVISIIGVIFFLVLDNNPNKEKVAEVFFTAISTENPDALQEVLYSKDERLAINKENSIILIEYFTKNPSKFNEIKNGIENNTYDEKIFIKEVEKKFFILPVYKVCVEPTFIKVKANFNNIKVKIGEKVYIDLVENGEIGPLIPGQYSINAELSNEYLNKSDIIKVNTFDDTDEVVLFNDLKTVNITSDNDDAILYVNNYNTELKIKDAKEFGPVDEFSVINAVAKVGEKDILSSKYTVDSNKNIFINFKEVREEEEDFKDEIHTLMRNYSSGFAYAVNYNNYDYIKDYIENGSAINSKQSKVITSIHNSNIRESFENIEILSFKYDKEKNIGEVVCNEIYAITRGANVPKVEEYKAVYSFRRNLQGELKLTDINSI